MRSNQVLLIAGATAFTVAGIVACGGGRSPVTPPTVAPPTTTTTTTTTLPPVQNPGCYPSPPPLYGIRVKVHDNGDGYRRILDARPIVVNVNGFCEQAVGQGGRFCFTRREGDADMALCDQAAMGIANTGRFGPTWYYEDRLCDGGSPGCTNNVNNQFLLVAKGSGTFQACAANNIPVSHDPATPGNRCGWCILDDGDTDCER